MQTYKVTPLKFDAKLVKEVTKRRAADENLATIAKALKTTSGRVAMAEMVGQVTRVDEADPAKLARAITKERKAGKSWGYLAARYGVTEGTCRAAYVAATGQPFTTLDYRRQAVEDKPVAAPITRGGVKAARGLASIGGVVVV